MSETKQDAGACPCRKALVDIRESLIDRKLECPADPTPDDGRFMYISRKAEALSTPCPLEAERDRLRAALKGAVEALEEQPCSCPSVTGTISVMLYNPTTGEIRYEKPRDPCNRCAALSAAKEAME